MDTAIRFARHAIFVLALSTLAACGGDEEVADNTADTEYDVALSGSIGDGPVLNATITVHAKDGEVLSTTVSDQNAGYNLELKTKGKYYPLTIDARGGIDLVTQLPPAFTLRSASTEPRRNSIANANPFTTLALSTATQTNGGLSTNAISSALAVAVGEFNSGLTSELSLDPMTVVIDDGNLAEIVKSSEMLAEVFRRTHEQLQPARPGLSIDGVIDAIGADLVDGTLDGAGAANADSLVSAMTMLVRSQVMLEGMTNELRVNGAVVTQQLDAIVRQLATGPSPALTSSRPVNAGMIEAAIAGLEGARALLPAAELDLLLGTLQSMSPGISPGSAGALLSADSGSSLDQSISVLSAGSDIDATTVLTPDAPPPPSNTPPVISGTPPSSVTENAAYSFVPTATDADGDGLSFTVANRPSWATFSTTTGTLAGTPTAADVGTYNNVVITVSDGIDTASLPAFSITVEAAPIGSATLSWTPPTENSDGSPLTNLAGYRVYWGTNPNSYASNVTINNAGISTFVVDGLSVGTTYYFSVTAINSSGVESTFSNEASKLVQ